MMYHPKQYIQSHFSVVIFKCHYRSKMLVIQYKTIDIHVFHSMLCFVWLYTGRYNIQNDYLTIKTIATVPLKQPWMILAKRPHKTAKTWWYIYNKTKHIKPTKKPRRQQNQYWPLIAGIIVVSIGKSRRWVTGISESNSRNEVSNKTVYILVASQLSWVRIHICHWAV